MLHREMPPMTGDRKPNTTLPILHSRMAYEHIAQGSIVE
jgi:hypothetical protein